MTETTPTETDGQIDEWFFGTIELGADLIETHADTLGFVTEEQIWNVAKQQYPDAPDYDIEDAIESLASRDGVVVETEQLLGRGEVVRFSRGDDR